MNTHGGIHDQGRPARLPAIGTKVTDAGNLRPDLPGRSRTWAIPDRPRRSPARRPRVAAIAGQKVPPAPPRPSHRALDSQHPAAVGTDRLICAAAAISRLPPLKVHNGGSGCGRQGRVHHAPCSVSAATSTQAAMCACRGRGSATLCDMTGLATAADWILVCCPGPVRPRKPSSRTGAHGAAERVPARGGVLVPGPHPGQLAGAMG
jgi:hypothetical protein